MRFFILPLLLIAFSLRAQVEQTTADTLAEDEDYSMYDNLDFADKAAKRYCTSKVLDLSPTKLISIGFDSQLNYRLESPSFNHLPYDSAAWEGQTSTYSAVGGLRLSANIPVISKNSIIIQAGFQYGQINFAGGSSDARQQTLHEALSQRGLKTLGLNSTLFKPFNERQFIIAQAAADLNGDYSFSNLMPLEYARVSAAFIYGWKPSDRKMIGFGASRTFRVGELNYIPVMLLNWTAENRKWGVEMLAPARANLRRTINARNMFFVGYELEGQSYRLSRDGGYSANKQHLELRRSELRFRVTYECSLHKFIWLSVQAGYRYNYSFELDSYASNNDLFRGFFGDQPYAQQNKLSNSPYLLASINLVSP